MNRTQWGLWIPLIFAFLFGIWLASSIVVLMIDYALDHSQSSPATSTIDQAQFDRGLVTALCGNNAELISPDSFSIQGKPQTFTLTLDGRIYEAMGVFCFNTSSTSTSTNQ